MNIYFETQNYLNDLEDFVTKRPPGHSIHRQFTRLREDLLKFIADNFEDERMEFLIGIANKTVDPVSGVKIAA